MENLVPITIVGSALMTAVLITAIAFFFGYRHRRLEHEERLKAIEKGIPLPDLGKVTPCGRRHDPLRKGIILLFLGVGLAIALYVTTGDGLRVAVWGLFVAFIGVGNLVWWAISRKLGDGADNQNGGF